VKVKNISSLSEAEITAITLRFLKNYYRSRLRDGDVEISADARGKGGIVADGFLSYPISGGGWFVATFESTSYDTRHEVRYFHRKDRLLADNMVVALWATAVGGMFNYGQQWINIKTYGPILPWVLFICVFIIIFFAFRIWAVSRRRYRAIQAVEQFKKYHSDEQWMAVARDVFYGSVDPHYIELRHQCIRYGFGLLLIDDKGKVVIQITPARDEVFEGRRQTVQFFSRQGLSKRIASISEQTWFKSVQDRVERVGGPLESFFQSLFRLPYKRQWAASIAALILIASIWYREFDAWTNRNVIPKLYAEEVLQRVRKFPEEPAGYRIDTPLFEQPAFVGDKIAYLDEWLAAKVEERLFFKDSPRNAVLKEVEYIAEFMDCSFLRALSRPAFLLVDAIYPDVEAATLRVEQIQSLGIPCGSIWLGCVDENSDSFLVYFGDFFSKEKDAAALGNEIKNRELSGTGDDFLSVKVWR
jgi:hypothetical protein